MWSLVFVNSCQLVLKSHAFVRVHRPSNRPCQILPFQCSEQLFICRHSVCHSPCSQQHSVLVVTFTPHLSRRVVLCCPHECFVLVVRIFSLLLPLQGLQPLLLLLCDNWPRIAWWPQILRHERLNGRSACVIPFSWVYPRRHPWSYVAALAGIYF